MLGFEKIQEFFSDITARTQENLPRTRHSRYAQEEAEIEQFQVLNNEYANQNLRLVKFAARCVRCFFFIGLGFVIIVAVGVPMRFVERSRRKTLRVHLYLQR